MHLRRLRRRDGRRHVHGHGQRTRHRRLRDRHGDRRATATPPSSRSTALVTASGDCAPGTLLARDTFSRTVDRRLGQRRPSAGHGPSLTPVRRLRRRRRRAARSSCPPRASPASRSLSSSRRARRRHHRPGRHRQGRGRRQPVGLRRSRARAATTSTAPSCAFAANGDGLRAASAASSATSRRPSAPSAVAGLTHTAGQRRSGCARRSTGASPTTIRVKAWADGALEPRAWDIDADELRGRRCRPPAPSACARTSAAPSSNAPITVSFDELRASRPDRRRRHRARRAPGPRRRRPAATSVVADLDRRTAETDVIGYHVYRATTTPVSTTGLPLSGIAPVDGRRPTSTPPPSTAPRTTTS